MFATPQNIRRNVRVRMLTRTISHIRTVFHYCCNFTFVQVMRRHAYVCSALFASPPRALALEAVCVVLVTVYISVLVFRLAIRLATSINVQMRYNVGWRLHVYSKSRVNLLRRTGFITTMPFIDEVNEN